MHYTNVVQLTVSLFGVNKVSYLFIANYIKKKQTKTSKTTLLSFDEEP